MKIDVRRWNELLLIASERKLTVEEEFELRKIELLAESLQPEESEY
jgi:hypothetical protein